MITYKCKSCGGQMNFSGAGGFVCPYCDSKTFFTDEEFKGNEKFRKMLLQYYKAEAEKKELDYSRDLLWEVTDTDHFTMENGQALEIAYLKKYDRSGYTCYLAKESVVYVFDDAKEAETFKNGIRKLVFPEADNRLQRSFPERKMEIGLKSGGKVLVYLRRPNCYPAEMFAPYVSEHLAWVISRMENICCALEYAGIEHGGIAPDTIWINPFSHEGLLFGDWRGIRSKRGTGDLVALRKTAIQLASDTREPRDLYHFLNSAPEADAFADFAKWDKVIEHGFGGHKFVRMDIV